MSFEEGQFFQHKTSINWKSIKTVAIHEAMDVLQTTNVLTRKYLFIEYLYQSTQKLIR